MPSLKQGLEFSGIITDMDNTTQWSDRELERVNALEDAKKKELEKYQEVIAAEAAVNAVDSSNPVNAPHIAALVARRNILRSQWEEYAEAIKKLRKP